MREGVKSHLTSKVVGQSVAFSPHFCFFPVPFSRGKGAHTPCFPSNSMKGERETDRGRETDGETDRQTDRCGQAERQEDNLSFTQTNKLLSQNGSNDPSFPQTLFCPWRNQMHIHKPRSAGSRVFQALCIFTRSSVYTAGFQKYKLQFIFLLELTARTQREPASRR